MHNKCWVTINWSETIEVVGAMCSKLCSQASTIKLPANIAAELRQSYSKKVSLKDRDQGSFEWLALLADDNVSRDTLIATSRYFPRPL